MSSSFAPASRRLLILVASLAVSLGLVLSAPRAQAQGKAEGPAKALQKKAMEEDYLATDFAKAQEKLEKAIAQCGTDKCSPQLRSKLKRDLGVVQIGGGLDKEKGINNFVEAIKLDATVALDPDIKTKDLDAAFAEAKKRAGSSAPAAPAGGGGGAAAAPTGGQPQGDFTHTPAAVQQVRTPIPVYVEYGGEEQLNRVIVRYKGFGMTDWKTVELKKMTEKGWGGLTPCADSQQGTTQYYLQGFNANNDVVATAGDRNNPYRVTVQTDKVEDPPHLPNATPPTQCADTGDCPPNFPGCKKAGAGAAVSTAEPEPTGKDGGEFCEEDSECKSNKCVDAKCTDYSAKLGPKLWVGVGAAVEWAFVPSSDNVCKLSKGATPINSENYYCVHSSSGVDYPSRDKNKESENTAIKSNKVNGGPAFGNVRLLLTLDYAVHPNVLLGLRLGIVLNTYPGEEAATDGKRFAVPLHLELRTTYVIGQKAIYKKGLSPYVMGAIGVGQFETAVKGISVTEEGKTKPRSDIDAWHLAGPAFVALGGGARVLVTPKFAILGGLRANFAFLNAFAPSVGPELSAQVGF